MGANDDPRISLLLGLYGQGVLDLEQVRRWGAELGLSRELLHELLTRCVGVLIDDRALLA